MPVCRRCKSDKAQAEFRKSSSCRSGYENTCKKCYSIQSTKAAHTRRAMKLCVACGEKSDKYLCGHCAEYHNIHTAQTRASRKREAVAYLGGICMDCKQRFECMAVYDFHHKIPAEKEVNIGNFLLKSWDQLVQELDKCVLLCLNCHRTRHAQERV